MGVVAQQHGDGQDAEGELVAELALAADDLALAHLLELAVGQADALLDVVVEQQPLLQQRADRETALLEVLDPGGAHQLVAEQVRDDRITSPLPARRPPPSLPGRHPPRPLAAAPRTSSPSAPRRW